MDARVKKVGEIAQDNLIAGVYPPATVTGIKIAAGQGVLVRGTVLAQSADGCVVLGTGTGETSADGAGTAKAAASTAGEAAYILADDVDATEAVSTTGYRTGNFNTAALVVAEGYELTDADRDALRKYGIVLNDNMQ